jgi:hypothetical protein
MTTQAVTVTMGNPQMSKIFGATVTDGAWSSPLLDTISSQNIGILTPNTTYTWAQPEYAAGLMAVRIQRSDTLAVSRRMFGVKAGQNCMESSGIAPVVINPTDILTVYALPVDATANQTNCLAWITTTKGTELFGATDIVDSTDTEIKSVINNMTLGDSFFNSALRSITIQLEDGAQLVDCSIIDAQGGTQWVAQGGFRGASTSSRSNVYNLKVEGMGLNITKGYSIKVQTITA